MVTERAQIRAPWLLRGYREGHHGYSEGIGKGAMVTKRVQGRTPLLLKGCRKEGHSYMGKSAMVT